MGGRWWAVGGGGWWALDGWWWCCRHHTYKDLDTPFIRIFMSLALTLAPPSLIFKYTSTIATARIDSGAPVGSPGRASLRSHSLPHTHHSCRIPRSLADEITAFEAYLDMCRNFDIILDHLFFSRIAQLHTTPRTSCGVLY